MLECSLAREESGDMGRMYYRHRLAFVWGVLGERVGVSASVLSNALAHSNHVFLGRSS